MWKRTAYRQTLKNILLRTELKTNGCIEWIGPINNKNRPCDIRYKNKSTKVARVVWELSKGSPPGKLHVCHHCDNTLCLNIGHLFLGTHADNMRDKIKKGRDKSCANKFRTATHCVNGHPFSGDNLIIADNGKRRRCKICRIQSDKKAKEKRKAYKGLRPKK